MAGCHNARRAESLEREEAHRTVGCRRAALGNARVNILRVVILSQVDTERVTLIENNDSSRQESCARFKLDTESVVAKGFVPDPR